MTTDIISNDRPKGQSPQDEVSRLRAENERLSRENAKLADIKKAAEASAAKYGGVPGDRIALKPIAKPPRFIVKKDRDIEGNEVPVAVRVPDATAELLKAGAVVPPEWFKPLCDDKGNVVRPPEATGLREGVDYRTL